MSAHPPRLELFVDVLDEQRQRALVLPTLTGAEFVQEILQEFRATRYLSNLPANYQLVRTGDGSAVDLAVPLGKQLHSRERLILVEHAPALPDQTKRLTQHVYLHDEETGNVYKLHWQPALIGRADATSHQTALLAVDLSTHVRGLRVSRAHAQITEENGQYSIQSLSQNPTTIKDAQGVTTLSGQRRPLKPGQIIYLDKSQIALTFLVREKERAA